MAGNDKSADKSSTFITLENMEDVMVSDQEEQKERRKEKMADEQHSEVNNIVDNTSNEMASDLEEDTQTEISHDQPMGMSQAKQKEAKSILKNLQPLSREEKLKLKVTQLERYCKTLNLIPATKIEFVDTLEKYITTHDENGRDITSPQDSTEVEQNHLWNKLANLEENLVIMQQSIKMNERDIILLQKDSDTSNIEKRMLERKLERRENELVKLKLDYEWTLEVKERNIAQFKLDSENEINQLKHQLETSENKLKSYISSKGKCNLTKEEECSSTETGDSAIKKEDKTLILGDYSLSEISTRDLNKNCEVRTMFDGRLDSIKSWVTEKLHLQVNTCIIYSGLMDIEEKCDTDSLLDKLGSLVTELKSKNDDLTVKVCELIPSSESVKEQTNKYNEKIKEWCSQNGMKFIPTNLFFTLGTGEINTNCFDQSQYHNLNRTGAIRLLDALAKDSPHLVCKNWDRVKNFRNLPRTNELRPHSFTSTQRETTDRSDDYKSPSTYAGAVRSGYHQQSVRGDQQRRVYPSRNTNGYQHTDYRASYNRDYYSDVRGNEGCYNCGNLDHYKNRCPFLFRY